MSDIQLSNAKNVELVTAQGVLVSRRRSMSPNLFSLVHWNSKRQNVILILNQVDTSHTLYKIYPLVVFTSIQLSLARGQPMVSHPVVTHYLLDWPWHWPLHTTWVLDQSHTASSSFQYRLRWYFEIWGRGLRPLRLTKYLKCMTFRFYKLHCFMLVLVSILLN